MFRVAGAVCVAVDCDLKLNCERFRRFSRRFPGASLGVPLGFETPFILERANPSKDGDAKPWAFGLSAGGCQAAEGMGR